MKIPFQSESPSPPLSATNAAQHVKQEPNIKREPVSPHDQRPHAHGHGAEAEPAADLDRRHRLQSESEQQAANFVSRLLDDDDDDVVVDDRFLKEEVKEEPRVVHQVCAKYRW